MGNAGSTRRSRRSSFSSGNTTPRQRPAIEVLINAESLLTAAIEAIDAANAECKSAAAAAAAHPGTDGIYKERLSAAGWKHHWAMRHLIEARDRYVGTNKLVRRVGVSVRY